MMRRNVLLLLVMALCAVNVYASEGKYLGKINKVNAASGEVIVSSPNAGDNIKAGDKLYVRVKDKAVILVAVYPMMATAKCRPAPGFNSYVSSITPGTSVYSYSSAVKNDVDISSVRGSGSEKELAMLCGKNFHDGNVQAYLSQIGGGTVLSFDELDSAFANAFGGNQSAKIVRTNTGFMYTVVSKGLSFNFDQAQVLQEIVLYADGVMGFAKYPLALPESLSFGDSRKDVESKLGKAQQYGGQGLLPFWGEYTSFGIKVTYWNESPNDFTLKIRYVSIKKPSVLN